jgi:peptidoglycan hydrolase-like protein with peptidoglycan-binding domain
MFICFFSLLLISSFTASPSFLLNKDVAYVHAQEAAQVPQATSSTPICNPNSPTLQSGSTGPKVMELQRLLTQLGYGSLLGQVGIDGKFGTATQNAVKKFQQDNRLQPLDGIVGPRTWGVLCKLVTLAASSSTTARPPQVQQPQQGQEAAVKQIPCGQTKPVKFKDGIIRGCAGYGGGSLETILLQMRTSGKIGITDEQIAILKGVASVETGGQIQSINTWDSAVVSFGFMQWTLRYGEFQRLISQVPDAFKNFGIELGGQYNFGKSTVPGIKGVTNPNELRFGNWPDRFFVAGKDPRIIAVEIRMAIDELNAFQNKLQSKFGTGLSDHFGSPTTVTLLFELNNNRPAYVSNVVSRTIQQTSGQDLTDADFNNILRKEIINEYSVRENDPAKGQRLTDKIMKTLGAGT